MIECIYFGALLVGSALGATPFGYTDRLSALNWANLDPTYSVCATGIYQSPININDTLAYSGSHPIINFPPIPNATVLNTGVLVKIRQRYSILRWPYISDPAISFPRPW